MHLFFLTTRKWLRNQWTKRTFSLYAPQKHHLAQSNMIWLLAYESTSRDRPTTLSKRQALRLLSSLSWAQRESYLEWHPLAKLCIIQLTLILMSSFKRNSALGSFIWVSVKQMLSRNWIKISGCQLITISCWALAYNKVQINKEG